MLSEGCRIRPVDDDIYSVLPEAPHNHLYDRRAAAYDAVVSTWLYNRIMWGTSPAHYIELAREAVSRMKGNMAFATASSHSGPGGS